MVAAVTLDSLGAILLVPATYLVLNLLEEYVVVPFVIGHRLLLNPVMLFVWLIFFKFKWLPWNIVSKVIVITLPIIGLTALILLLNIVAPSSHDVRVIT